MIQLRHPTRLPLFDHISIKRTKGWMVVEVWCMPLHPSKTSNIQILSLRRLCFRYSWRLSYVLCMTVQLDWYRRNVLNRALHYSFLHFLHRDLQCTAFTISHFLNTITPRHQPPFFLIPSILNHFKQEAKKEFCDLQLTLLPQGSIFGG